MSRPEAISVLGSLVLGGTAALFLTFGYQSSPPVPPVAPAPVSAPVQPAETVPSPRPRPVLPKGKTTRQPKAKTGLAQPVPARKAPSKQLCALIDLGMAVGGRTRVYAEGRVRGHSQAAVEDTIRACGH